MKVLLLTKDDESVAEYIVALKKISIHCGFGDETQVKKRLRNRLVIGLREDAIKNRLLGEGAALTWDRAVEVSTSMDTARQGTRVMRPTQDVNRVQRGGYQKQGQSYSSERKKCYRCDGDHGGKCRYEKEKCYNCDKIGHIARACKSEQGQGHATQSRGGSYQGRGRAEGRGQGRTEEEVSYASLY